MANLLLATAIVTQSGCFYFTRNFLRQRDEYTATTQDFRIATTEKGAELYARFAPADFTFIAEDRPWLSNPFAVHFARRDASRSSATVFIIADDPSQAATVTSRPTVPEYRTIIDGSELSGGVLLGSDAVLPAAPPRTYVVHVYNWHYTSNPLRYCAAPVFVIGDVFANIFTLGYAGGFGCAKQDLLDRQRHEGLELEPLTNMGIGDGH
jgi:hypothetical protein